MKEILEVLRFLFTEYFFQKRRKKVIHSKWRSRPHSRHNKFRGPQYPKISNIKNPKLPAPHEVIIPDVSDIPQGVQTNHNSVPIKKVEPITGYDRLRGVTIPRPTRSYNLEQVRGTNLTIKEAAQYFPKTLVMYHPALGEVVFQVMYALPMSSHAYDIIKVRMKSSKPDIQHECDLPTELFGYLHSKEDWEQRVNEILVRRMKNILNLMYGAY